MKLKLLSVLTISLASILAACQTTVPSQPQKQVVNVQQNLKQTLEAYTWSYQPTNSKTPIQLSFNAGHLSIYSGCNRMGTSVEVKGQTLSTSIVVSTQMACEGLMEQEQFAANLFDKQTFTFNFTQTDSEHPVLNITTSAGKNYQFKGTATPETKYQGQAEIIFLEISPETKACVGVARQQCLQVREIKYDAQGLKTSTGDWELFYNQIEGFKHQPNQRVILRVKRFTLQNPVADQSRYVYVHDMTVEWELVK